MEFDLVQLEGKLAGPWSATRDDPPYTTSNIDLTRGELSVLLKALRLLAVVRAATK